MTKTDFKTVLNFLKTYKISEDGKEIECVSKEDLLTLIDLLEEKHDTYYYQDMPITNPTPWYYRTNPWYYRPDYIVTCDSSKVNNTVHTSSSNTKLQNDTIGTIA